MARRRRKWDPAQHPRDERGRFRAVTVRAEVGVPLTRRTRLTTGSYIRFERVRR